MTRCKHLNGELIEVWDGYHYRSVVNGVIAIDGDNEQGFPIRYIYTCKDCKKSWKATSTIGFKPKWLKAIASQL
jgi:hypothetical protein